MGTNYYRIPTEEEIENKKLELELAIKEMSIASNSIGREFDISDWDFWDIYTPWDKFIENTKVHIGKRSSGWKFLWNFHGKKYFTNKKELLAFLSNGRIIDEYNEDIDTEEFVEMALSWGEPNGFVYNQHYVDTIEKGTYTDRANFDIDIDGLRVSTSTEFC